MSVAKWRDSYRSSGLQALEDKPRTSRPVLIDGQSRAAITALACSTPPAGRAARWTWRLLADRAVELGYCQSLSHTCARTILKKLSPAPFEKAVVYRKDGLYLWARMEQLLSLYALPYSPAYPVICFDERPCFLIGDSVAGLEMKAGKPVRGHYA